MPTWIKVMVPHHLLMRMEEYNITHPSDEINISKIVKDAINEKIQGMELNTEYCWECKKLKPINKFYERENRFCISCLESGKTNHRKGDWYENRKLAISKTGGKCAVCGSEYNAVHHIIPVAKGGTDNFDNLIPLCNNCHFNAHNGNFTHKHGLNREFLLKYLPKTSEAREILDELTA